MKEISLIPAEASTPRNLERNISALNAPLAGLLDHVGLPTHGILSPVDERRKVIHSLESVLEILPPEDRERAAYISKFAICVTVGLFDGALSFLWDETIKALRKKLIDFDLAYFFAIASSLSSRYKGLQAPDDLQAVSEHDLLEICRRMGLIDDVNHRRLETVNYFRNHASAAHPNEHEISGIELLGFLENCLRYAICAPVEHSAVQVKRLLENVRRHEIAVRDYKAIATEIAKLPPQRIEDILQVFFGMYCDASSGQNTLDNVRGLASSIWGMVSADFKHRIGAKFGYYRANGDVPGKDRVQEFLDAVDGNDYKDEDSLGEELIEKLQSLRSAHYGHNNFYSEYPLAQSIAQSLPRSGIPKASQRAFVKTISTCFVGNGCGYRDGVDERAIPYYKQFLARFGDAEMIIFADLFTDHEFTGDLGRTKARQRAIMLSRSLKKRTKNVLILKVLDVIAGSPDLQKAALTREYRSAMKELTPA